jgi:hypothetical protein
MRAGATALRVRSRQRTFDVPCDWASCDETHELAMQMSAQLQQSTQEVLAGLVERVTYHNAENGFCVLRARARGHRDVVTVVGHAASISAGEWITASGDWVNDRTHGQHAIDAKLF